MKLTPIGAQIAQQGPRERTAVAMKLIRPQNPEKITQYVTNALCYDAVAFVRFLLGRMITPQQLVANTGIAWAPTFNRAGHLWHGGAIAAGTAVLFRRPAHDPVKNRPVRNPGPFHVAIALGRGCAVRSVNGGKLGAGWQSIGDGNIDIITGSMEPYPEAQRQPTLFQYGGPTEICEVWLSSV